MERIRTHPDGCLSIMAPAKINLFLHITGQRADGYHLLESLFAFTKKGDELRVQPADTLSLTVEGPFKGQIPVDDSNLVIKAAHLLAEKARLDKGAQITLIKNLPPASGIGGGSSDAAATLVALNQLWRTNLTDTDLHHIALTVGADVPACLAYRPVMVRGVGEKLTPVSLKWDAGILIVNPLKTLSTASVFKAFKRFRASRSLSPFDMAVLDLERAMASPDDLKVFTSNSLSEPARDMCDDIFKIEYFLAHNSQADLVRMSGSGASVFALYPSLEAAEAVAERVRKHAPHWWVWADELAV